MLNQTHLTDDRVSKTRVPRLINLLNVKTKYIFEYRVTFSE